MSDDSEVIALVKELLIMNRAESTATVESQSLKGVEGRKSKWKRLRQELVQVLYRRDRNGS
jgi:hypothetical protein